jgi:L-alanine-DL-glutamate epimerase-like enolase superfamily enzyme
MGMRRKAAIDVALAARRAFLEGKPVYHLLIQEQREEIAVRFLGGDRAADLAKEYGIAREYVYRLVKRYLTSKREG